jgi:hypothetical protein
MVIEMPTPEEILAEEEKLKKLEEMRKGVKSIQLEGELTIDIPDNLEKQISAKKGDINEMKGNTSFVARAWF